MSDPLNYQTVCYCMELFHLSSLILATLTLSCGCPFDSARRLHIYTAIHISHTLRNHAITKTKRNGLDNCRILVLLHFHIKCIRTIFICPYYGCTSTHIHILNSLDHAYNSTPLCILAFAFSSST